MRHAATAGGPPSFEPPEQLLQGYYFDRDCSPGKADPVRSPNPRATRSHARAWAAILRSAGRTPPRPAASESLRPSEKYRLR